MEWSAGQAGRPALLLAETSQILSKQLSYCETQASRLMLTAQPAYVKEVLSYFTYLQLLRR